MRYFQYTGLLLAGIVCVCISAIHAQPSPDRFEYRQIHMGVETRIVLYAPNEETAITASRAAFSRIADLEDIMSDYRPSSELMQLSAASGGDARPVSDELFYVLEYSRNMAEKTKGAFDVTAGPLIRVWRESRQNKELPSSEVLEEAKARVGWENMVLDPEKKTVQLTVPGMMLDLGGIGKGYASDEAIRVLGQHGIRSAMIEMGGDVVASGAPPNRDGWRINIPYAPPEASEIEIADRAVSISGDTEQYLEIDGRRYSHIVDPATGLGLTHRTAVTVVAPNGITADAYATAISVMGKAPEPGPALEHDGIEVYILHIDDHNGDFDRHSIHNQ